MSRLKYPLKLGRGIDPRCLRRALTKLDLSGFGMAAAGVARPTHTASRTRPQEQPTDRVAGLAWSTRPASNALRLEQPTDDVAGVGGSTRPASIGSKPQEQPTDDGGSRSRWVNSLSFRSLYVYEQPPDAALPESGQSARPASKELNVLRQPTDDVAGVAGSTPPASKRFVHPSENQLTALPESLGQLPRLQQLDVRNNQLTTLPDWLGQLPQLQRLYVQNNQLTLLLESLRNIESLRKLYLHGNDELGLPPEVLGPTWEHVPCDQKEIARQAGRDSGLLFPDAGRGAAAE